MESNTVINSAEGKASQMPWIPHKLESVTARIRIATAPRTMEMAKDGLGCSVAAK